MKLNAAEIIDGWHFCWEWDGLLIHPSHPEAETCQCIPHALLEKYAAQREVALNERRPRSE